MAPQKEEQYIDRHTSAHGIRTFEILQWDRNSYLTHVTLPRLSRKNCSLVVLEITHMVVK